MPKGIMRTAALVAVSALLGGLVGALVIYLVLEDIVELPRKPATGVGSRPAASSPAPRQPAGASKAPAPSKVAAGDEWGAQLDAAGKVVAAGRLREAQEMYLTVLLVDPTHEAAMRGLVRVVRLMAGGDLAVLRKQAAEYQQAVALGLETEEHYTAPAMELLARANLQAAGIKPSAQGATQPARAVPPTTGKQAQPRPEPRSAAAPQPRPAARPAAPKPPTSLPQTPSPTTVSPKTSPPPSPAELSAPSATSSPKAPAQAPPPTVPLNVNEPFVTVTVGPISSGERASAMTAELTIAGYAARVRRIEAGSYVITLGPYRQSVAARTASYIKSRFGQDLSVALSRAE